MIIGQNGAVTEEQAAAIEAQRVAQQEAAKREAGEVKRLEKLSKPALKSEIRGILRTTGKVNNLCFCYGLALLAVLGEGLFDGNDPYRCKTRVPRPKTTRQRKQPTASTLGGKK